MSPGRALYASHAPALLALLALAALMLCAHPAPAAEVIMHSVKLQDDEVVMRFDVRSQAELCYVSVALELRGERRGPESLTLRGDLGLVAPGPDKTIVWNTPADLTGGYAGPLSGEIVATEVRREPLGGLEFAWVPGGCFEQGCGAGCKDGDTDERPVQPVCLGGFWLARQETPAALYEDFLRENGQVAKPGQTAQAEGPAKDVTWFQARDFAAWYADKTGKDYRLPSEAEWEYACRSGGRWGQYATAGGDAGEPGAAGGWVNAEGLITGPSPANLLGLEALSGGVWEWVADPYLEYGSGKDAGPRNAGNAGGNSGWRVLRGGRDKGDVHHARCANRYGRAPGESDATTGFRLALDPE